MVYIINILGACQMTHTSQVATSDPSSEIPAATKISSKRKICQIKIKH